jgi:O-antigen ligase
MPRAILSVRRGSPQIKFKSSMLYTIILAILLVIASSSESISSRVNNILHLSHLELKGIPASSAGVRLHQWNSAIDLIKQEPLSGYGGSTKKHLIKISDMPKRVIGNFDHSHNSYLELGVTYSLGATFIFMLGFLLYRLIKAYKNNQINSEFALWGIS